MQYNLKNTGAAKARKGECQQQGGTICGAIHGPRGTIFSAMVGPGGPSFRSRGTDFGGDQLSYDKPIVQNCVSSRKITRHSRLSVWGWCQHAHES